MVRSALLVLVLALHANAQVPSIHVRVDQLGYHPLAVKMAVLREPVVGHDAPAPISPPQAMEVRRTSDGAVVFTGTATPWNGGATHSGSGDRAWWFDFSALTTPGELFVRDVVNQHDSATFAIDPDAHDDALRASVRMFTHQRCGTAKLATHVGAGWADGACHVGAEQDTDCRLVSDPSPATSLDLSGGWHDAGDYNKYVNFADDAVHDLLGAYEEDPLRWPDDTDIPESGNGVPDLLDEIRYELEWLLRMQRPDGSVLHKVSNTSFAAASPPSVDTVVRRYGAASGSATISAGGVFARAAIAFEALPDASSAQFGATLRAAAVAAWSYVVANPSSFPSSFDNSGFVSAAAEDDPYHQEMNRLRAAVFLFRLTGVTSYRDHVDAVYTQSHLFQWTWAAPWEQTAQDALLAYLDTPDATPSVTAAIRAQFLAAMSGGGQQGALFGDADPYRAWLPDNDHVWGSTRVKAHQGWLVGRMFTLGLDPVNTARWREAHQGYVHYFHGVNPTGFTYLTRIPNAEQSVTQMYHAWFGDGTVWDETGASPVGPPPGYLVGGPNRDFQPDAAYGGPPIVPPEGQPPLKSYKDWNTGWPENSWSVTECHIPYQAAYVRMMTPFAIGPGVRLGLDVADAPASPGTLSFTASGIQPGQAVAVLWSPSLGTFQLTTGPWTVDLGVALTANPLAQLLFVGVAAADGTASQSLAIPPGFAGLSLHLQATEAGTTPYPSQSRVVTRVLR